MLRRVGRTAWAVHVCEPTTIGPLVGRVEGGGSDDFTSKWFLTKLGNDGLARLVAGFPDKSAEAVCTFGYSPGPGEKPILFQGRTRVGFRGLPWMLALRVLPMSIVYSNAHVLTARTGVYRPAQRAPELR